MLNYLQEHIEMDVDRIIDTNNNEFVLSSPKGAGSMALRLDPILICDLTILLSASAVRDFHLPHFLVFPHPLGGSILVQLFGGFRLTGLEKRLGGKANFMLPCSDQGDSMLFWDRETTGRHPLVFEWIRDCNRQQMDV